MNKQPVEIVSLILSFLSPLEQSNLHICKHWNLAIRYNRTCLQKEIWKEYSYALHLKEPTKFIMMTAYRGYKDLIDLYIEKKERTLYSQFWNRGMIKAAQGGHKDLVDFFIEKMLNLN